MLLFIFMIVVVVSITISMNMSYGEKQSLEDDKEYIIVHCPDPGTGGTINYPPGTECGTISDDFDDSNKKNNDDVNEEEEKAMKEND